MKPDRPAKSQLVLWIGLVAVVSIALLVVIRFSRTPLSHSSLAPHKIDASTSGKINRGMTEEEVGTILGGPPGDYTTRTVAGYGYTFFGYVPPHQPSAEWFFNTRSLLVWFEDGKVVYAMEGDAFREWTWLEKTLGVELFPLRD